jgi:hypothetical protein
MKSAGIKTSSKRPKVRNIGGLHENPPAQRYSGVLTAPPSSPVRADRPKLFCCGDFVFTQAFD